jgi:hypothetical protein
MTNKENNMPYCKECGTENEEGAKFCQKCGTPLQATGVVYRRSSEWLTGKILALVFGGFILLVALGLIAGGGALMWSQTALTDRDGYMIAGPVPLSVNSYAIVQNNINIQLDNGFGTPTNQNIVSIKISATSNNGKSIFIGIVPQQSAVTYFNGVNIDRITQFNWAPGSMMRRGTPTYQTIPGKEPSTPPTSQVIWVAQASGTSTQTVTWTPTTGDYWVVIMNADGSPQVDANVQVGARVTILSWIGWGLLIGGLLAAMAGVVVIYFGAIHRR